MVEYVDKEELLRCLEKEIKESNEYRMAVVDTDFIDLVNDATVVEDVVEVVRCKDCKKHGRRDCMVNRKMACGDHETTTKANDFCSYGERKSEN